MVGRNFQPIPLPATLPSTFRCLQLHIPDGDDYVLMLFRELSRLGSWTTYERDANKTGTQVAELWRAAINSSLPESPCGEMAITGIRVNECNLEVQYGSSETWVVVGSLSECAIEGPQGPQGIQGIQGAKGDKGDQGEQGAPGGTQPGEVLDGGEEIAPGDCRDFTLAVFGNGLTIVPFRVLPGYTIQVVSYDGAWTNDDAPLSSWYCANGGAFVLGSCGANEDGTAPDGSFIATHNVARLIARYGSTYLDPMADPVTIPSGDEYPLELLMNDADRTDNAGSVLVNLQVCNPAVAELEVWAGESPNGRGTWQYMGDGVWRGTTAYRNPDYVIDMFVKKNGVNVCFNITSFTIISGSSSYHASYYCGGGYLENGARDAACWISHFEASNSGLVFEVTVEECT